MAVPKQTTVAEPKSLSGSSLHTGREVTLTLKPAAANAGVTFKRLDLPDEPLVHAHIDNVKHIERATTLGEGSVKIHTVEHLLSALVGNGIDNALVELDANEPPIGDGSSKHFNELVRSAGKKELDANVEYYEVKEPIRVTGKDGAYMIAWPSNSFEVTATNANHTGKHTQFKHYVLSQDDYAEEIAPARTFVFYEEVKPLMDKGLIKGGNLDNAVVIRGDSILSTEPLRFDDEFVRHKILDIIGDLSLFPKKIKAHIYASKPSHALNVEMARAILKQHNNYVQNLMPVEYIPVGDSGFDVNDVMKILPHRYPFLMVDRILSFEEAKKATGQKAVTMNEEFFQGHFPGHPVMPGVLQLEAMAQVASILMLKSAENAGKLGYFMSADKVKFRKPVVPGDVLIIQVELLKHKGRIGKATGKCLVNKEVVSEAELMFALM